MNNKETNKNIMQHPKNRNKFTLKNVIIFLLLICALISTGQLIIKSFASSKTNKENPSIPSERWVTKKVYSEVNDTYFAFADCSSKAIKVKDDSVSLHLFIRRDNDGNYISYIKFPGLNSSIKLKELALISANKQFELPYYFNSGENAYMFEDLTRLIEVVASHQAFSIKLIADNDKQDYIFQFAPMSENLF